MTDQNKISFICPSIRTHLWDEFYNTLSKSCKRYDHEVIFITPFDTSFDKPNVKIIKSYRSPLGAWMEGYEASTGNIIASMVDDDIFIEDGIDEGLDLLFSSGPNTMLNLRYAESQNRTEKEFDMSYWRSWTHPALRLPGIPSHYDWSVHFVFSKDLYNRIGSLDPAFNYLNFSSHDLIFRAQYLGAKMIQTPRTVSLTDHMPGCSGDHAAIHIADSIDYELFKCIYGSPNALESRSKVNYLTSWKQLPEVWTIRFNPNNLPKTYNDLRKS